jgi:hypothetical protein
MRANVAEFLSSFVLPLVTGGDIHIARPLAMSDLGHFEVDLPHASPEQVAVDDARTDVLAALVVRPPALVLDNDELCLAAALHNALFLVHPSADSRLMTKRTLLRFIDTTRRLAGQPLSQNRRRVLARHSLLHNVFDLTRTDTKISWWTGSAQFYGQQPPHRLLKWSALRRVRQEVSTAAYADLLTSEDASPIMATLLRRSPLTQLLASHPQAPPLHWEDAVFVLRDVELARAVAYECLQPTEPGAQLAAPARFAAAFEQMLERSPDAGDVRTVAAFLVHINALLALAELRIRDRTSMSPLLATVLAPERAGKRPRGLTTLVALPNALARVDPRLTAPPGLADEPKLKARWDIHRRQVASGVGEAVIDTLVGRLTRHLGSRVAPDSAPQTSINS